MQLSRLAAGWSIALVFKRGQKSSMKTFQWTLWVRQKNPTSQAWRWQGALMKLCYGSQEKLCCVKLLIPEWRSVKARQADHDESASSRPAEARQRAGSRSLPSAISSQEIHKALLLRIPYLRRSVTFYFVIAERHATRDETAESVLRWASNPWRKT